MNASTQTSPTRRRNGRYVLLTAVIIGVVLASAAMLRAGWADDPPANYDEITAVLAEPEPLMPSPWTGVSDDTWTELWRAASDVNVIFSLWQADNSAGDTRFEMTFTKVVWDEDEDSLAPCKPAEDESWKEFSDYLRRIGFAVAFDEPQLTNGEYPVPEIHAEMATVHLDATTREIAAQQGTNIFRWLKDHELSCAS